MGMGYDPLPTPHPYWGGGHYLSKPHPLGACGASPHIYQPPVIFFHNSHTEWV